LQACNGIEAPTYILATFIAQKLNMVASSCLAANLFGAGALNVGPH
jgi:hypothetical protein